MEKVGSPTNATCFFHTFYVNIQSYALDGVLLSVTFYFRGLLGSAPVLIPSSWLHFIFLSAPNLDFIHQFLRKTVHHLIKTQRSGQITMLIMHSGSQLRE